MPDQISVATVREGLLARYPVTFYFIIAYGFAWLVWVPLALSQDGAGVLSFHSPIGPLRLSSSLPLWAHACRRSS